MKSYIGILALVLGLLLSYGIAWHLDSDSPPERPSRRLLDSSGIAAGQPAPAPEPAQACSSVSPDTYRAAGAEPASQADATHQSRPSLRQDVDPAGCEVQP